jgi:hypothetical protein
MTLSSVVSLLLDTCCINNSESAKMNTITDEGFRISKESVYNTVCVLQVKPTTHLHLVPRTGMVGLFTLLYASIGPVATTWSIGHP